MTKHKQDIENELFYASEHMKGYMDYQARIDELDEVYRKAEAFDEIVQSYEDNTGLGEMDEDLCDCVTFIEKTGDIIGRHESEESE